MKKKILIPSAILVALTIGGISLANPSVKPVKTVKAAQVVPVAPEVKIIPGDPTTAPVPLTTQTWKVQDGVPVKDNSVDPSPSSAPTPTATPDPATPESALTPSVDPPAPVVITITPGKP